MVVRGGGWLRGLGCGGGGGGGDYQRGAVGGRWGSCTQDSRNSY